MADAGEEKTATHLRFRGHASPHRPAAAAASRIGDSAPWQHRCSEGKSTVMYRRFPLGVMVFCAIWVGFKSQVIRYSKGVDSAEGRWRSSDRG
jgi:hypothetical protein